MPNTNEELERIKGLIDQLVELGAPTKTSRDLRAWLEEETADPLATLSIHVAIALEGNYTVTLDGTEVKGKTLKGCVLALGCQMGWGRTQEDIVAYLKKLPPSPNSAMLVGILGVK